MDLGATIRVAAPFLSGVFGAVAGAFVVLLLIRARRIKRSYRGDLPIVNGQALPSRGTETLRSGTEKTSHLLRKFVEYAGNVSLTS